MNSGRWLNAMLGGAALLGIIAGPALGAPAIREQVAVSGPFVTYGDVFEDAGALAGQRIAASPEPGRRMVLSAADLATPAQRLGLDPAVAAAVVVTRTGMKVPLSVIEDALRTALQSRTSAAKLALSLSNPRMEMFAPEGWAGALRVSDVTYDERSGRFTATLDIPGDSQIGNGLAVTGRADPIVQVPVLRRAVGAGEIIAAADLDWQDLQAPRASSNIVTDPSALIGQAARRPLAADRPLRGTDVQKPVMIQKGTLVSMVVEAPGMVLTAVGRALQDGGRGDVIELTNPQSKRVVQGIITGPGAVTIASRAQVLGAL